MKHSRIAPAATFRYLHVNAVRLDAWRMAYFGCVPQRKLRSPLPHALSGNQHVQVLAKKRRLDIAVALFRWMLQHGRASEHTYMALLRVGFTTHADMQR